jgi:hypothetical protein
MDQPRNVIYLVIILPILKSQKMMNRDHGTRNHPKGNQKTNTVAPGGDIDLLSSIFNSHYEEGSALLQSKYMAARAARRLAPPVGGLFATSAKKLPVRQKKQRTSPLVLSEECCCGEACDGC